MNHSPASILKVQGVPNVVKATATNCSMRLEAHVRSKSTIGIPKQTMCRHRSWLPYWSKFILKLQQRTTPGVEKRRSWSTLSCSEVLSHSTLTICLASRLWQTKKTASSMCQKDKACCTDQCNSLTLPARSCSGRLVDVKPARALVWIIALTPTRGITATSTNVSSQDAMRLTIRAVTMVDRNWKTLAILAPVACKGDSTGKYAWKMSSTTAQAQALFGLFDKSLGNLGQS